ncbi:unnamed protein product, partial [Medioppia subpectinata]
TLLFATPNRPADENQHNSRRRPISAYYSDDFHISNTTETTFPLITTDNYKYRTGALYSDQARACLTMFDHSSGRDFSPHQAMNGSGAAPVGEFERP